MMKSKDILKRLLKSYGTYYNVNTENPMPPFAAEASFYSAGEHYFLVKSAKLAKEESNEHVFFYRSETLNAEDVARLAKLSWEAGLLRVTPHSAHRNTDITLIYIADSIEAEAFRAVKKCKFYKSYRFSFHGWSAFRAAAVECETYKTVFNGRGSALKGFFTKLMASCKKSGQTGHKP